MIRPIYKHTFEFQKEITIRFTTIYVESVSIQSTMFSAIYIVKASTQFHAK